MAYTTTDNNYGTAKLIVGTSGKANYLTIATALTAASSGDTIFLLPGTYTENLTLKAGVNLTAYVCDAQTPNVTIVGKCSFSSAGTVTISGIRLQTNSDFALAVTGSVASIVNLFNCVLNCSTGVGISYTSSDATSSVNLFFCNGNLGHSSAAYHSMSSTGTLQYEYCNFGNSIASTTASDNSAGAVAARFCFFGGVLSTSSTGGFTANNIVVNSGTNTAALTANGSGNTSSYHSVFFSGSASAISVGGTLTLEDSSLVSSNTNSITGAGTLISTALSFASSSSIINTTTQTLGVFYGGSYKGRATSTVPPVGMIGERISATGTSVAISTGATPNICSIALTPGIWDITAILSIAGATTGTNSACSISATSATLSGSTGNDIVTDTFVRSAYAMSVPAFRVSLSAASTTYYLVGYCLYTVGSATGTGRISAVRVA